MRIFLKLEKIRKFAEESMYEKNSFRKHLQQNWKAENLPVVAGRLVYSPLKWIHIFCCYENGTIVFFQILKLPIVKMMQQKRIIDESYFSMSFISEFISRSVSYEQSSSEAPFQKHKMQEA